ncbi:Fic/DOC family protein [Stomatohabitans albus]|uniref:Fic/DOC family protein n=1 Tax=Stomatohabitans albus TaxID=3110766 RepID=UPI00300C1339
MQQPDHPDRPPASTDLPAVSPATQTVMDEVIAKSLPDGSTPTPEFLQGLQGVFAELETEYARLREVLGLPRVQYADTAALRTAFAIYIDDAEYEPSLQPGETLPQGIVDRNWASYFCPYPYKDVLKNKLNITNADLLTDIDFALGAQRAVELMSNQGVIPLPATDSTLSELHAYLFGDLYDWAGNFRIVNMAKGQTSAFADPHTGEIYWFLSAVRHMIEIVPWANLDRPTFVHAIAAIFAYVNYAHPFREGNGRASRMFLRHIARQSPFRLQFALTTPDAWNTASAASTVSDTQLMPAPEPLLSVFDAVTIGPIPGPHAHDYAPNPPTAQRGLSFDVTAYWPQLTEELTSVEQYILNESLTDCFLEGWTPNSYLVRNLVTWIRGQYTHEEYLQAVLDDLER